MKGTTFGFAAVLVVATAGGLSSTAATAIHGSGKLAEWCAVTNLGTENCQFSTQAQCASAISGVGGFCRMSGYGTEPSRRNG